MLAASSAAVATIEGLKNNVLRRLRPTVTPLRVGSNLKQNKHKNEVNTLMYTPKKGIKNEIHVNTKATIAKAFIVLLI